MMYFNNTSTTANYTELLECPGCPSDTISSIAWCDESLNINPVLAAGSWNGILTIWEINIKRDIPIKSFSVDGINVNTYPINNIIGKLQLNLNSSINSVSYFANQTLIAGTIDGKVHCVMSNSNVSTAIYQHEAPVVKILTSNKHGVILSVGLDLSMKIFNISSNSIIKVKTLDEIPVDAAMNDDYIIIATEKKNLIVYKTSMIDEMPKIILCNEFVFPINKVAIQPNGTMVCVGGVEGRGRCLNVTDVANVSFYFRSHRMTDTGIMATAQTAAEKCYCYAFNDISFHASTGICISAGGDSTYSTWNLKARQRVATSDKQQGPVTAVSFSNMHGLFAYAIGYDWSAGVHGNTNMHSKVFVKTIDQYQLQKRDQR